MLREDLSCDKAVVLDEIDTALSYNPTELFTVEDVVEVVRGAVYNSRDYGGDGDDLAAIVRLKSGKFGAIEGWADYTGWDCWSAADVTVHGNADEAWFNGIGTDSRALIERAEEAAATPPEPEQVPASEVGAGDGEVGR